ncbi:S-layer homology domain-containing protein [Candidatus Gracilibacteria bacterium]|nr:S-layer homology domain-containing protein [Candidatus Gracilibacteria bacterium]
MKKFLLFLSLFSLFSVPAMAQSFPDVPEDHANYAAIEFLDERGIISGYDDGTFGPDNLVNRAEAVTIIVGALDISHEGDYDVLFPDVVKDQWFFDFVMSAQKIGFVNGYDDGNFEPADEVNLAESLKILTQAAEVELPEVDQKVFMDVPADIWFAPHALYARSNNLILSDNEGEIHASDSMKRSDFAELIYRMIQVRENDGVAFPLYTNWPSYEGSTLPFKIKNNPDWNIIVHEDEVIFLHADEDYGQFNSTRIYPKTGLLKVTLDQNEDFSNSSHYFQNIQRAFLGASFTEFEWRGMPALEVLYPEDRVVDWYVYLDDGSVLVVYTEFGNGVLGYNLHQYIKAMLSTFSYMEINMNAVDNSELLSEIFSMILVEGKGMEIIGKLPDRIIIVTDTIGVGSGPVDYYYSEVLNHTFKYEREADVVLDKREGNTSAF